MQYLCQNRPPNSSIKFDERYEGIGFLAKVERLINIHEVTEKNRKSKFYVTITYLSFFRERVTHFLSNSFFSHNHDYVFAGSVLHRLFTIKKNLHVYHVVLFYATLVNSE